jgi:hypothetical protein
MGEAYLDGEIVVSVPMAWGVVRDEEQLSRGSMGDNMSASGVRRDLKGRRR